MKSVIEKIEHARSLTNQLPELQVDFHSLLNRGKESDKTFLIYYNSEGKRTEISYRQFYNVVLDTARFYHSKGLTHGDKIATISHNHWFNKIRCTTFLFGVTSNQIQIVPNFFN